MGDLTWLMVLQQWECGPPYYTTVRVWVAVEMLYLEPSGWKVTTQLDS